MVLALMRKLGLWRFAAAAGIVLGFTLVAEALYRIFDTTRLSMVFLAAVVVSAVTLGSWPAYFAALLAFVIYNVYLVEPRFTLQLASAEDVLVLVVFLGVAVLAGGLAGRLRDEATRNRLRARATGALFETSRRLSSTSDEDAIRQHIVEQIAVAARGQAVITDQDRLWRHPATIDAPSFNDQMSAGSGWRIRPMNADGANLGLAAWRVLGEEKPDPERDQLINILIEMGSAAMLRARLSSVHAEVTAAAKTEQLRTALLSSISHDLRTPLSAILASASSLKTFGAQFSPDVREDLITTIEEEAERLNMFVANLLSMTKLESGALHLESQAFDAGEVVNRVADRLQRARHRPVTRSSPDGLMSQGDPILLEQALGNVLENAARYSADSGRIEIRCAERDGHVVIEVEDEGPGVVDEDLERIFEKFYRSGESTGISQGTGLGLSIARGLMEAMNGAVAATRRTDGRSGLLITLSLERAPA